VRGRRGRGICGRRVPLSLGVKSLTLSLRAERRGDGGKTHLLNLKLPTGTRVRLVLMLAVPAFVADEHVICHRARHNRQNSSQR
jgi:hypothetical protein